MKPIIKHFSEWFIVLLCLGLAFLHGLLLYGATSGRDDVYMTYWAAKALNDFGTFVNYNGTTLEQSSSLLHVLLLALLHSLFKTPLPVLGVLFSATMGGLTLLVTWRLAVFLKIPSAWFVALFYALFPYLVYWSFSGLETTLVALVVVGLIYATIRFLTQQVSIASFSLSSLAISAYILVRPEAIFVILAFVSSIAFLLFQAKPLVATYLKKLITLLGISIVVFTLVSGWRYHMFDQLFPQPVYAKTGTMETAKLVLSLEYLTKHFWLPSLVFLAVLTVFSYRKVLRYAYYDSRRIAFITLLSFVAATLAFIIAVGGDWMEGGRFLIPILPLFLLLGLFGNAGNVRLQPASKIILLSLALMASIDTAKFFKERSIGLPLFYAASVYQPVLQDFKISETAFSWFEKANQEHLRDIPVLHLLQHIMARLINVEPIPIVIATGQMGMIPFHLTQKYFGKVEFMDMKGLTTPHFVRCEITRSVARNHFGLHLTQSNFFTNFKAIYTQCFPKRPAIIYELGGPRRIKMAEKNGYRAVYAQSGAILTGDSWTQKKAWAGQYVVIRADLANKINWLESQYYSWPGSK